MCVLAGPSRHTKLQTKSCSIHDPRTVTIPTETASGSHPCCVVSVTYPRPSPFHGGNTGSNPVGDAKSNQGVTGISPGTRGTIAPDLVPFTCPQSCLNNKDLSKDSALCHHRAAVGELRNHTILGARLRSAMPQSAAVRTCPSCADIFKHEIRVEALVKRATNASARPSTFAWPLPADWRFQRRNQT